MTINPDPLIRAVTDARKRDYSEGLVDGVRMALRMLLGHHESSTGGTPFKGALSDEAKAWAGAVLRKLDADEVAAADDPG